MMHWIQLHDTARPANSTFVNMERVAGLYSSKSIDGSHRYTVLTVDSETAFCVQETPEQIFSAMQSPAVYPLARLPGDVGVPHASPSNPSNST